MFSEHIMSFDNMKKQAEVHAKRHTDFDCKNQLSMIGTTSDVTAVMDLLSSEDEAVSFEKVKPIPQELLKFNPANIKPSFYSQHRAFEAFTWREEHWGTTADARNVKLDVIDLSPVEIEKINAGLPEEAKGDMYVEKIAAYKFDTCIAPPSAIYFELSKRFPKVLFHYTFDIECEEESVAGWAIGKGGKIRNRAQYPTSFKTMKLHLEGFSETWLSLKDEESEDDE